MDPLDQLVCDLDSFPSLPDVIIRVSSALDTEGADLEEVAEMIALDASLASQVMRLANSAQFGALRPAPSIKPAILRLGTRDVRAIALTVGVTRALPELPAPHDLRTFWTFGLTCALLMQRLARDVGYEEPDSAYLAGLVHLIGDAYLALHHSARYQDALEMGLRDGIPLDAALAEEFGRDHTEVGARVLAHWNFPLEIIQIVRHQYSPQHAERLAVPSALLYASHHIARDLGLGIADPSYEVGSWMKRLPHALTDSLSRSLRTSPDESLRALREEAHEISTFAASVFSGLGPAS